MVTHYMAAKRKEITKPHSIITAKMTLTAKEQDLLSLLMLKVKESADSELFKAGSFNPMNPEEIKNIPTFFELDIKELAEILGTSTRTLKKQNRCPNTGKFLPSALEKACQAIRNQDIRVRNGRGFMGRRLVSDATFDAESGKLTLETTRTMAGVMLDYGLKNDNFGKTDMRLFFTLNGVYEKRILELISRFKNERDFKITLGEFCDILNVDPANYSTMANFRKSVIEKPLAKIIKWSDGMWVSQEGCPKGFHLKRGAKSNDMITFKMRYNNPNKEEKEIEVPVDPIAQAFEGQIRAGIDSVIGLYLQYVVENEVTVPEDVMEILRVKVPSGEYIDH